MTRKINEIAKIQRFYKLLLNNAFFLASADEICLHVDVNA